MAKTSTASSKKTSKKTSKKASSKKASKKATSKKTSKMTAKKATQSKPATGPAPVVHFEIGCQNLARTSAFYGGLLGWTYDQSMPSMAMVDNLGGYVKNPTDGIGGHLSTLGHEPHQYVTIYAMVPDIEATLKKAKRLGGTTIIPKQEVPGMGWFAWLGDPEGNVIGLWTPLAGG